MKKRIFAIIMVLVLSLTMLSACGKKDNTADDGESPLKVAVFLPVTGDMAQTGLEIRTGIELAIDMVNKDGGINGRELTIEVFDSKNDAKESVELARKIGQDESYLAVIGDFSSTCCLAAAPVYEEYGLVQASPSAGTDDLGKSGPYNFQFGLRNTTGGVFAAEIMHQKYLGVNSVAFLYINNDSGVIVGETYEETAKELGMTTYMEAIAAGETDFTAILTKLRQTDCELVHIFATYTEAANCVKQIRQMGWDVRVAVNGTSATSEFIEILGDDAEGIYSEESFNREILESDDEFFSNLRSEFTTRTDGLTFSALAAQGFDTAWYVAEAMRTIEGEITRDGLRQALMDLNGFEGINGSIELDENGAAVRKYAITQIENGELVVKTDFNYY